jgi:MoaA/NifB/PqqE/SkfB family radical SAM enzyme
MLPGHTSSWRGLGPPGGKGQRMIFRESFQRTADPVLARTLFKHSVGSVEIEIFSFCNRTCSFCPNSFIDRRSRNHFMNPALYSKILDDLASIGYEKIIWYSRYNEPTSDRVFLNRLAEARRKLPNARLQTFTNGDYLDKQYILDLRDAGLNDLRIMAYLANNAVPTEAAFMNLMVQRLTKIGLPWEFVTPKLVRIDVPGITVTYHYAFFEQVGTNRGGTLSTGGCADRAAPCIIPLTSMYIDHDGSVVPCCDIRSDVAAHKDFVVFKLTPENSIFEAYADSRLVDWRRGLAFFGPKQAPCNTCNRGEGPETPELAAVFDAVAPWIGREVPTPQADAA